MNKGCQYSRSHTFLSTKRSNNVEKEGRCRLIVHKLIKEKLFGTQKLQGDQMPRQARLDFPGTKEKGSNLKEKGSNLRLTFDLDFN